MPLRAVAFAVAHVLLYHGLTSLRPDSPLRPVWVVAICGCCLFAVRSPIIAAAVPCGVGLEYVIGFILHASNFLCVAKLEPDGEKTTRQKRIWGINQICDARWGADRGKFAFKGKLPTRTRLFLERARDAICLYGVIWAIGEYGVETLPDDYLGVPDGFLTRFGQMQQREVVVRVWTAFRTYAQQYCSLRMCHSIASCIGLLCGQEPAQWPPLFGDVAEAYTLRRWFGTFWHHLMRKAFTSHAVALCTGPLGMPQRSRVTRLAVLVLSFAISAGMHILTAPGLELCTAWPQVRYYMTIIAAIVIEDVVLGLLSAKSGTAGRRTGTRPTPPLSLRAVGYVWVACFHVWAASTLIYGMWQQCYL